MENASKALIMAGSVLIALMIIGALILMFSNLTSYQETDVQSTREAQVTEFNNQFTTYDRKDVRGSDIISLMNRAIDYNNRKTEEGYQEVNVVTNIDITQLKYDKDDILSLFGTSNKIDQEVMKHVLNEVQILESKYELKYITQLSSNISNVMDSEDKTKKLLPKALREYGGYPVIKEDTAKYYQYSQFKRAHFDCTDRKYDNNTGRIIELKFEFNGTIN